MATFGMLSGSCRGAKVNRSQDVIVGAKHDQDINVKTGTDNATCCITGLAVLPGGRLVLADSVNFKIKTVNEQSDQVLTELKTSSLPWDVAAISNNKVAVTLPNEQKVVFVTVGDNNLNIDRTLNVNGCCYGVDYRKDKLAVSYLNPHKVQVLNLQGTVLYTITADKQGKALFNHPTYLTYGQDDTTLYVSNQIGDNIMCVKLDGTVVATYTDSDLFNPLKPAVDSHGNVYVCTLGTRQVHQISKDCTKMQVLLSEADGLSQPYSICLSEEEDKLYVGMFTNDNIKVYTTERRPQ